MKRYAFAAVVAFLAAAAVVGVAAADAGPLADAGLDQEVGVNTTVQLDGTGSSHPDGTIDSYEWSIETPAGARTTPACADCGRTNFRPTEPGRHNVTIVVTDSKGRSSTDTLYVYVRDFGPTVRLDGDTDPQTGERTPYEATVEANGSDLEELTWQVDGRTVDREAMSGQSSVAGRTFRFSGSGPYRLEAVAEDTTGRSDRDTLIVEPRPEPETDDSTEEVVLNDESGASDGTTDRSCTQAAAVGTDYVCVASGEEGGGENLVQGNGGEVCTGTDLSTCDKQNDPAGGTTGGADKITSSEDSDQKIQSSDNVPGALTGGIDRSLIGPSDTDPGRGGII